jgi:hypothetical protein
MARRYGTALQERLGDEGYEALENIMDDRQREPVTVDRFERRLAEEAALRHDDIAEVRLEIGNVRLEIANVRLEVGGVRQDLSQQIAGVRFDLIKWMFVFWIGQSVTTVGLVVAVLRVMRP